MGRILALRGEVHFRRGNLVQAQTLYEGALTILEGDWGRDSQHLLPCSKLTQLSFDLRRITLRQPVSMRAPRESASSKHWRRPTRLFRKKHRVSLCLESAIWISQRGLSSLDLSLGYGWVLDGRKQPRVGCHCLIYGGRSQDRTVDLLLVRQESPTSIIHFEQLMVPRKPRTPAI